MSKYLRIERENVFIDILYKMKQNHCGLIIDGFSSNFIDFQNIVDGNHFNSMSFDQKMNFNGLIKYSDFYTTANGVYIDIENRKMIFLADDFNEILGEDIFKIIPDLHRLEKFGFEMEALDFLYEELFIDENKIFPDFTHEEWKIFIEKNLQNNGLVYVENDE